MPTRGGGLDEDGKRSLGALTLDWRTVVEVTLPPSLVLEDGEHRPAVLLRPTQLLLNELPIEAGAVARARRSTPAGLRSGLGPRVRRYRPLELPAIACPLGLGLGLGLRLRLLRRLSLALRLRLWLGLGLQQRRLGVESARNG